ncbi:uncharacterized protein BHQ10_006835 [Talaromyces amestolkiae]|uniref:Uncharacterized protein n=1 Tax=Talaromyces amestolkiae TaxID=1196081 RepID=A0A364L4W5_TALAM|nr:uncharacterized protein BHQ10_006835 [Talaromyces amestolkiae]RAO70823.1 hypothetical protein BHQ10_006835 [Talaromyces amestolkiae]
MTMNRGSVRGVLFRNRMTACLDDIQEESAESSSDEDVPEVQVHKLKDWKLELQKFHAESYHYRQPVMMYSITHELEFMGGYTYPPAHLNCTRTVLIFWRTAKFDLETLDYLKHDEPARYEKACAGFEKLYGYSANKFEYRLASLPEEVLDCLGRRVILKYYSSWVKRPEEQRKLIKTCDWIINTCLEFPVDKIKASFDDSCQTMGVKVKDNSG